MKLLDDLTAIVEQVDSALIIRLTDKNLADGQDEMLHVLLHEACQAAVANSVPWIHEPDDGDHAALDQVLARLLEEEMGLAPGLPIHRADEQVEELARYPVVTTVEQWEGLRAADCESAAADGVSS